MNKKQKTVLLIAGLLMLLHGMFWLGEGPNLCNHYSGSHCIEKIYNTGSLLGFYIAIGTPAALFYYFFKDKNKPS